MRYLSLFLLLSVVGLIGCEDAVETNVTGFRASQNIFEELDENQTIDLVITAEGTIGEDLQVPYQATASSAQKGLDFNIPDGVLTFSEGDSQETIAVEIVGDVNLEIRETFDITLQFEGRDTRFTFTINDNDEMETLEEDAEGFLSEKDLPSMRLIWSDEFDGSSLNTEDWTYELGDGCDKGICGWGNEELQSYTDESSNLSIENGKMTITAVESAGNYTSARIITQDKVEVTFGRIDIRAKMPKGQGMWPALWMLGANIDDVGWPSCGEIDIMELVGHEPEVTHGTVHYDDDGYKSSSGLKTLSTGDLSDKFHVYSIVWDQDIITWYLDGEPFKTFTKSQTNNYPFNAPFFLIANIAVGGRWPGNPDATTVFPQTMVVDYMRIYQ